VDLDRLSLQEAAKMSKLIELLGTPVSPDDCEQCINVCEAAATLYRKQLLLSTEATKRHGG
jgi:hypothetical protein